MQVKALELVPRCSQCYGDSPKAYKREQIQPMANVTSEYQAAYKDWPWHPRTQSMKPSQKAIFAEKTKSHMERKSIYGLDYVFNPPPKKNAPKKQKSDDKEYTSDLSDNTQPQVYFPKKAILTRLKSPNVENAQVIHPSNSQPFQADTIYSVSYTPFDVSTMEACKQSSIKGKDNLEIQPSRKAEVQRSTAQDDFIHHKNVIKPEAIRPAENNERPTEPIEKSTEYKDFYSGKRKNAHLGKSKPEPKFEAISTAMADFRKPEGFEKPVPCPPSVTNHFVTAKFDGRTTFSMAYKPFPVKRYELPIWAKKPKYKRPEGGMIVNSLYMHDFRDPMVIKPPEPIKPEMANKYKIIMNDKGDRKFEYVSTYKHDFLQWENVQPRESYRTIEIYQPPKEKMVCETNHRSDFTVIKADKMKPCRHTSQHRELDTGTGMTFVTTYNENFRMVRPKSTPSAATAEHGSAQQRSVSAMAGTADSLSTYRPNKIPTPDLKITPGNILTEQASLKPDAWANNSAQTGQGQVDILKIYHTCDKCKMKEEECKCKNENS